MVDEVKLLPCPFCGNTPSHIEADESQGTKWGSVVCCIRGPEVRTGYDTSPNAEWHKDAIEAWNERALLSPTPDTSQKPHGYLYDWTHSSATGRPDEDFTSFVKTFGEAKRWPQHRNIRAVYLAPDTSTLPVVMTDEQIKGVTLELMVLHDVAISAAMQNQSFDDWRLQKRKVLESAIEAALTNARNSVVPEGWQLVPVEPTAAMLDAAAHASMQHLLDCIHNPEKTDELGSEENLRKTHASRYRCMLAAAPKGEPK